MNSPLDDLTACIGRITALLTELIELQRPFVSEVCAECLEPCCARVRHLFDEKDVIFLKLTRQRPDLRKRSARRRGCAHHTPAGCGLEAVSRPFTCHRYLCDRLKGDMMNADPRILPQLQQKLDQLDVLRSSMWVCYLESR